MTRARPLTAVMLPKAELVGEVLGAAKIGYPDIKVTGFTGTLLSIHNVTGKGLNGAVMIDAPKVPDPMAVPAAPYRL
jgi:hypothetical protein